MASPRKRYSNLARRALDLDLLALPGVERRYRGGKAVVYRLPLSPSEASRVYTCELVVYPGRRSPGMYVLSPDLHVLAKGRDLPHVYPSDRKGVRLCLYYPNYREWEPGMKLSETFLPWTLRWLWYFEMWLWSDVWEGGGMHPGGARRRYGVNKRRKSKVIDEHATED